MMFFVFVLCTVSLVITGCHGYGMTEPSLELVFSPICSKESQNLTVERDTTVEFRVDPNNFDRPAAVICDQFTIHNASAENSFKLFYPNVFDQNILEQGSLENDGEKWDDWWGCGGFLDVAADWHSGDLKEKLDNDTYFDQTFPEWPSLGVPIHEIYSKNSMVESNCCGLMYFVKDITISENGQVTITRYSEMGNCGRINFLCLNDEIPCTRHTLTVTCAPGIEILRQNVIREVPEDETWSIELTPDVDNHYIQLKDHISVG